MCVLILLYVSSYCWFDIGRTEKEGKSGKDEYERARQVRAVRANHNIYLNLELKRGSKELNKAAKLRVLAQFYCQFTPTGVFSMG